MTDLRYPLVIFDFDGTLADSAGGIVAGIQHTFTTHGFPTPPADAVRQKIGTSLLGTMRAFLPDPTDHALIDQLITTYRAYYVTHAIPTTQLFAGIPELLAQLTHAGHTLGIATNKLHHTVQEMCTLYRVEHHFRYILGADSVTYPKPDPEMLTRMMEESDVTPAQTLMIGDTSVDIACAQAAGVDICAVAYGAHNRAELTLYQPTFLVDRVETLATIIAASDPVPGKIPQE